MLSDDEYRIILSIEQALDHRAILSTLSRCANSGPLRGAEYRQRLAEALHWARERVDCRYRELILRSRVALQLSHQLLNSSPAQPPSGR